MRLFVPVFNNAGSTNSVASPLCQTLELKMHLPDNLVAVMNDTKWDELRLAMYELEPSPSYRTKCWENGYISPWDGEWFYHFRECGYAIIEWVEIRIESENQKQNVISALSKVHVPTEEIPLGFRVYGYIKVGQSVQYA